MARAGPATRLRPRLPLCLCNTACHAAPARRRPHVVHGHALLCGAARRPWAAPLPPGLRCWCRELGSSARRRQPGADGPVGLDATTRGARPNRRAASKGQLCPRCGSGRRTGVRCALSRGQGCAGQLPDTLGTPHCPCCATARSLAAAGAGPLAWSSVTPLRPAARTFFTPAPLHCRVLRCTGCGLRPPKHLDGVRWRPGALHGRDSGVRGGDDRQQMRASGAPHGHNHSRCLRPKTRSERGAAWPNIAAAQRWAPQECAARLAADNTRATGVCVHREGGGGGRCARMGGLHTSERPVVARGRPSHQQA
jgi:hypothetical protein